MKERVIRRNFSQVKKWLKQNAGRFDHQPLMARAIADRLPEFTFEGVNQGIKVVFGNYGNIEIGMIYASECWDFIAEYDVYPIKNPVKGYFCKECNEYDPAAVKYYPTLEELLAAHSFEPMLEWANEKLTKDHRIRLSTDKLPDASGKSTGGWTGAEIVKAIRTRKTPPAVSGKRTSKLPQGFVLQKNGIYVLEMPVLIQINGEMQ